MPCLAWPSLENISPTLFTTDAGEGAEAQGHFVKAETEILARNACMGIYKSSGYSPPEKVPKAYQSWPHGSLDGVTLHVSSGLHFSRPCPEIPSLSKGRPPLTAFVHV